MSHQTTAHVSCSISQEISKRKPITNDQLHKGNLHFQRLADFEWKYYGKREIHGGNKTDTTVEVFTSRSSAFLGINIYRMQNSPVTVCITELCYEIQC